MTSSPTSAFGCRLHRKKGGAPCETRMSARENGEKSALAFKYFQRQVLAVIPIEIHISSDFPQCSRLSFSLSLSRRPWIDSSGTVDGAGIYRIANRLIF